MLNILLLPLLGGYLYLSTRHRHRALILRQSSYHLFFKAALWGLGFFVLARFIVLTLGLAIPETAVGWSWIEHRYVPEPFRPYAGTALLSLLLGFAGRMMNHVSDAEAESTNTLLPGSSQYETYRAIHQRGNGVERLAAHAYQTDELLSVTLTTDKYYIGFVSEIPEPSREYTAIELAPVSSGYRDSQTKQMVETDNYAEVLAQFGSDRKTKGMPGPELIVTNDFTVVLPVEQIVSMKLFDPDVFRSFQQNRSRAEAEATPEVEA